MIDKEIISQMKELISIIEKHNYNYYVLDNPTISDKEYDILYDKLIQLEKQYNFVLPNSPSKKVGGDVTLKKFKKHVHKHKLYSLNKVNNEEDFYKWILDIATNHPGCEFCLELKYDGLTICLTYDNGKLVTGATRGNGTIGEDVTEQVKTIKNIPVEIPFKGNIEINGECLMSLSNFKAYNKNAAEPLKNARNAAAGALRNLDPAVTATRNLEAIFYNINYIKPSDKEEGKAKALEEVGITTVSSANQFLQKNGFKTGVYYKCFTDVDKLWDEIKRLEEFKNNFDYLTDGLVVKLNNIKLKEELGYTEKFPRADVAFKFEAEEISTILNNVVWQVGRTGKITPIAILEPVELAGATIARATLNNFDDIKKKQVKIGSRIFIRRSNEVIPEVLGLSEDLPGSKEIIPPLNCPSCNQPLVEIGPNLFCVNKNCPDMNKDKIVHFCSREAMNIEGISDKTINQFYDKLEIKSVVDLYNIRRENLLNLEKFKDKKTDNLLASIEKSKDVKLANFIYSLSILGIGIKAAKMLANRFSTLDKIIHASLNDLVEIDGIGEVLALNLTNFFQNKDNIELIDNLISQGVRVQNADNSNKFNDYITDKTFVITGTFSQYSREELTKIIESYKGKVSSAVSKKTNYVLAGENAGSKLENAKKLEIKILNINEFLNMIK